MSQTTEYQVCKKCGTVFGSMDSNGPRMGARSMSLSTAVCPKCGGDVVWQSKDQIMKGANHNLRFVWVVIVVVCVGAAILKYVVFK